MSLSRFWYEPVFTPSDFDRLFDEAFNARTGNGNTGGDLQRSRGTSGPLRPRMDLHENKDSNTITATFELPGLKKEDVSIDVHNNRLTVSGESKISSEHDENGYAVRERRFGKFSRSLQLPQGIKDGDIKASMENGVLTVTFPKSSPEAAPKKISIA
ncbi:small heat shock protein [Punctularia strigosozonata HHB-11173 SS5]|uniref:small heat shock protein n=1 Tax=Punctularia strigosozonata (strain HHB-11173) TaxID=741275 RepID=UPI0004416A0B|nr:small heat shock protein [Punctularia strigosozonata HHB-11173 SS5]EIN11794.1 small heat shock protein [Punctularia strigosozonata HHB-11173 SS5]